MRASPLMPSQKFERRKWVYITGRGHSGSTVLDAMLGNAEDIESVGELVSGMGRYEDKCSCGVKFRNCSYWKSARALFEEIAGAKWDDAVRAMTGQAHIRAFPRTLFANARNPWVTELAEYFESMAAAIGNNHTMVVDSSKEVTRALFLLRFVPGTKVIHLVRHPARILQSNYYRIEKGRGIKILRHTFKPKKLVFPFLVASCIMWFVGNLLAELARQFSRKNVLRVRYEDIVRSPDQELARIEKFIGVSLDKVKKNIRESRSFQVGHNIGGNHMRMAGEFVFDSQGGKRTGLPKRYEIITVLLCWPLLLMYGYYKGQ